MSITLILGRHPKPCCEAPPLHNGLHMHPCSHVQAQVQRVCMAAVISEGGPESCKIRHSAWWLCKSPVSRAMRTCRA